MMDRRRFLRLTGTCVTLSAVAAPAAAGTATLPATINKAGSQRMLSQRCAKAWLMKREGVLPERAKGILDQSVARFERQLTELKSELSNDALRSGGVQLEREWSAYRPLLADGNGDPALLWSGNEAVLAAAQSLTVAFERSAGTPAGHLINLSGRQRMLSQRMAKAYYFRQLGVNAVPAGAMLDGAMTEFARAQAELKQAPGNTPQITAELALAEQQWQFFELALGAGRDARAAADVATTSERILEQMDLVVGLYEKLARDAQA
jgi:nitrate/nitrite-specific signal transduction histidine kinase